jgi:hypothetical protein
MRTWALHLTFFISFQQLPVLTSLDDDWRDAMISFTLWDALLIQPSWWKLKLPLNQHHLRSETRSPSVFQKYHGMNIVFPMEPCVLIQLFEKQTLECQQG